MFGFLTTLFPLFVLACPSLGICLRGFFAVYSIDFLHSLLVATVLIKDIDHVIVSVRQSEKLRIDLFSGCILTINCLSCSSASLSPKLDFKSL